MESKAVSVATDGIGRANRTIHKCSRFERVITIMAENTKPCSVCGGALVEKPTGSSAAFSGTKAGHPAPKPSPVYGWFCERCDRFYASDEVEAR